MPFQLNRILHADAVSGLRTIPDDFVDCVLTSPPYWSCRTYGNAPTAWRDGEATALGEERSLVAYVGHLVEVFDEVRRVLKPSGTLWVNLADVYFGSWGNYAAVGASGSPRSGSGTDRCTRWRRRFAADPTWRPPASRSHAGLQSKSLCLIPQRFAIAMCDRGWVLRNHIVWHKPNHMPSSVKDRLTPTWESLLFLTASKTYAFDLDAIRVPHKGKTRMDRPTSQRESFHPRGHRLPPRPGEAHACHPKGKNPGDCWSIPTHSGKRDHPAVFPERLCERPILAGSPPCGIVLDPFMGSGTTAVVAQRLGRQWLGIEQNQRFVKLASDRIDAAQSERSKDAQKERDAH